MDPTLAIDGNAALVAPLAPVVPVMAPPSLTRDSFNSQSLGRGLNAHVKQVGTRKSIALVHRAPSTASLRSNPSIFRNIRSLNHPVSLPSWDRSAFASYPSYQYSLDYPLVSSPCLISYPAPKCRLTWSSIQCRN